MSLSAGGCVAPPSCPPLPAAGPDPDATALPPRYLAATFEPRSDSAVAWLAASVPALARLELLADGDLYPQNVATVELTEDHGLAASVTLRNLAPDSEYR